MLTIRPPLPLAQLSDSRLYELDEKDAGGRKYAFQIVIGDGTPSGARNQRLPILHALTPLLSAQFSVQKTNLAAPDRVPFRDWLNDLKQAKKDKLKSQAVRRWF